jgi:hypothetical protein
MFQELAREIVPPLPSPKDSLAGADIRVAAVEAATEARLPPFPIGRLAASLIRSDPTAGRRPL